MQGGRDESVRLLKREMERTRALTQDAFGQHLAQWAGQGVLAMELEVDDGLPQRAVVESNGPSTIEGGTLALTALLAQGPTVGIGWLRLATAAAVGSLDQLHQGLTVGAEHGVGPSAAARAARRDDQVA